MAVFDAPCVVTNWFPFTLRRHCYARGPDRRADIARAGPE